ncbi:GNAT family N-acetyltransferase [Streptomyces lasiicapitis]|uniref:GNAT family N-acetyltransferase n=1 Tax=Streptomyces lasiicapitis TaxID=1923961 RepID=A0ABQ2LWC7_9ACTN|nr:GNAT family N-acetyltransferase [Streptomyces lasiicapitis]GGO43860.1 GNAT family N-acetyltransferase [Streptomyces lasiicapitis]
MDLLVRHRGAADLGACARVLAEVHRGDGYPTNWPADPAGWLTPSGMVGAWVAVAGPGGGVAGHVGLCAPGDGDIAPEMWGERGGAGGVAVVSRLFVAPSARGRGIGAVLLDRVAEAARERGLWPVLDVVASDAGAVALYERAGWELLGVGEQRWSARQTVTVRCYAGSAPPA